jgi:hypothetical protein
VGDAAPGGPDAPQDSELDRQITDAANVIRQRVVDEPAPE